MTDYSEQVRRWAARYFELSVPDRISNVRIQDGELWIDYKPEDPADPSQQDYGWSTLPDVIDIEQLLYEILGRD